MERRTLTQIKQDIRSCWDGVAVGHQMGDSIVIRHFLTEARAYEREYTIRRSLGTVCPAG